jgi:hypothetical protein
VEHTLTAYYSLDLLLTRRRHAKLVSTLPRRGPSTSTRGVCAEHVDLPRLGVE